MSVKKSNKQLYRVIQIMTLTGTLVVANVLFTMVTHRHIWSGQDVWIHKLPAVLLIQA